MKHFHISSSDNEKCICMYLMHRMINNICDLVMVDIVNKMKSNYIGNYVEMKCMKIIIVLYFKVKRIFNEILDSFTIITRI